MTDIRLAPLASVTDWPFRLLCFEQGCACAYTEMVSAQGFVYAGFQKAVQDLLLRAEGEKKLIVQIFGQDPEIMAESARRLNAMERFDGIDINMGCPMRKVTSGGAGAALMQTPELASRIMEQVVRASALPVSVKMRTGWDHDHVNCVDMACRAEACGVREITVHGRTRDQMYSGQADWEIIQEVRRHVHIPVLGNGDLLDAQAVGRRAETCHVDGFMIARGAQGNPWIFSQAEKILTGKPVQTIPMEQRLPVMIRHYEMMLKWKPEKVAVTEMRKHLAWYLHGLRGAARMRDLLNHITDPGTVIRSLEDFASQAEN